MPAVAGSTWEFVQPVVRDIPPPRTLTPTTGAVMPRMDVAPVGGGYEGIIVIVLGLVAVAVLVMVIRARRRRN